LLTKVGILEICDPEDNRRWRGGMRVELAVVEGAILRLSAVLITASAAALGLVPMLFATGPGSEIQNHSPRL